MRSIQAMLALSVFVAGSAVAATPASFAAVDRASAAACTRASGLRNASAGPVTRFSDAFLMDARTVTGTWPQAHMRESRATMLCLYNRRTGRAETQEMVAAPTPGPGASMEAIRDVDWRVTEIDGRRPIGQQPLTVMFGSDGRISGSSGCNRFTGSYSLMGARLQITSPMAGTRMACLPGIDTQETTFLQLLERGGEVSRAGPNGLTIRADDGRMLRLVRR